VTHDVLEGDPFDAAPPAPAPAVSAEVAPDLDWAVQRIRAARRPVIVAGKGAWYPLVSAALVALAEAVEAPVCHTWEGHGAMPTVHPLSLGPYRIMETHPAVVAELSAADLIVGVGVRVGTEPFRALDDDYGDRLLILDAADAPTRDHGPAFGSVPSLAASLRGLAAVVGPSPSANSARASCSEAQRSLARGLEVEMERYAGMRPWHIGRAIAALSERLTPDIVVTSDVSNVKLWVPFQLLLLNMQNGTPRCGDSCCAIPGRYSGSTKTKASSKRTYHAVSRASSGSTCRTPNGNCTTESRSIFLSSTRPTKRSGAASVS